MKKRKKLIILPLLLVRSTSNYFRVCANKRMKSVGFLLILVTELIFGLLDSEIISSLKTS